MTKQDTFIEYLKIIPFAGTAALNVFLNGGVDLVCHGQLKNEDRLYLTAASNTDDVQCRYVLTGAESSAIIFSI